MGRKAFDVKTQPYKGTPLLKIAQEQVFAAAIAGKNQWKQNLEDGAGAEGAHGRPYWSSGDAVRSITTSPQTQGELDYVVGSDLVQVAVAEHGRTPAWPPVDPDNPGDPNPISDWVHETSGLPKRGDPEFDETVLGVARKLARERIGGFAPGLLAGETTGKEYREKARRAVRDAVEARVVRGRTR